MPLVYQQNINPFSKLGVWHITEQESFFMGEVPLQREITHPHKRLQHLAGRFLLKELFPGFPYSLIKIADTRKPFLENESYHFSISHCGQYAAAIVSTANRVGVDVELVTARVEKIKHKFLSVPEQSQIEKLCVVDKNSWHTYLTLAWSIKESLFKWYGDGEVDFIDHLHIENITMDGNNGKACCFVLKKTTTKLVVHFLIFNNNCLSWVSSEA